MKKKKGKVPDCKECKPAVIDENLPIMYFVEKYMSTMFSDGGLSAEGITLALEEPWVEDDDRTSYAKRIIVYLNTLKSEVNKDT